MPDDRSRQDSYAPWLARWAVWTLWWELVVAITAGVIFAVYGLVLERQYEKEGIIQGADSFYAAQDVVFPLWLLAAVVTPFVVYTRVRRESSNLER